MAYRTYFDAQTGAYLGSYGGPDEGCPWPGQPSVEGQHDASTTLVEGAPVRVFDLPAAVARARAAVDAAAEAARLTWITPGSGQAMVYQAKVEEAADLVGRGGGNAEDYPLLAASIGIEGATVADVAAAVLAVRAQWLALAAAIERARLGAKHALDALAEGATQADVDAIVATAAFPRADDE